MNVLKKLTGYKQSLDKPQLRPKAVLLDVNGTLFAATAAAPAFKELGLDEGLVEVKRQPNGLKLRLTCFSNAMLPHRAHIDLQSAVPANFKAPSNVHASWTCAKAMCSYTVMLTRIDAYNGTVATFFLEH
jgi:hypothetical protein